MFGCGTGVVVVSIRQIQYEGKLYDIPYHSSVLILRDTMTALQRKRIERDDWCHVIPEWKGVKGEEQAAGQEVFA